MFNIAVFASGSGSNAENLVSHFKDSTVGRISLILSNKKEACVLKRAERLGVPYDTFTYKEFQDSDHIISLLDKYRIDFIILAGFLLKVPDYLLAKYPGKILNIHPALLPKYGGKGMYGRYVHEAVIAAKEKKSGITIHTIDSQYDCGKTIYQSICTITEDDTPESLEAKIHELEKAYPQVAEDYIESEFTDL
ncbi:MAG: phosphoribosylglycinamide formyltransferase [Bacteroidales bacterium]|nr:phosphoribosylglycinamide formyltransferase [Bacteroidales bacterium]